MDDNESTIPIMEVARPVILKQDLESIQSRNRQQVRRFCFIRSCDEPSTKDGSTVRYVQNLRTTYRAT